MHGAGFGFRTQQIGSADLNARRAQRHRGRYAARIGDPAGGDHGYPDGFDDLRQQRKSSNLGGQILRQKNSTMTAGLRALRNDGIDASLLQPQRFCDSRGRGDHLRAPFRYARHEIRGRQAKMKAHHGRLELLQHIGRRGNEGLARGAAGALVRLNSVLPEVGSQQLAPGRFAPRIRNRHGVAKEIDVERPVGCGANGLQFRAHAIGSEHRTGQ